MKEEQIINAARILFHKFGFKKVSMDEIAQEAGVTKKTIYVYFKSKQDLLNYFIQEEIHNMKDIIEAVESKHLEPFDTVSQCLYRLLTYKKDKDFLNIITREAELLKDPIIIEGLRKIDEQIQKYIRDKLEKAKDNGVINFQDADITAFLIYKMYIALMFEWNDTNKKLDEKMIATSITEILKNGLRKDVE